MYRIFDAEIDTEFVKFDFWRKLISMEKSTMYAMANSVPQFARKEVKRWPTRMLSYFRRIRWMNILEIEKPCPKNEEKIDSVKIVTLEDDGKMQTRSKVKEKSTDPIAESDD